METVSGARRIYIMDPESLAKTAAALTKPLVKLIEVVESGIGALGRPFLVILREHADGRARLIREGYDHRLTLLRARHAEELAAVAGQPPKQLSSGDPVDVVDVEVIFEASDEAELLAARSMETEQQAKRRANVVTIAAEAADHIGDNVSDAPVDPDWVARFFTHAQDVSTEQLQRLWGRLLAGEVQRPGNVPLRTLELLRNLSVGEARLLEGLAKRLTTSGAYLPYGRHALPDRELRLLQDAGVVHESIGILVWSVEKQAPPGVARGPFNEPPGSATLRYPSGHALSIEAERHFYQVNVWRIRPSAYALLNVLAARTDVAYLEALVEGLQEESYFRAALSGPVTSSPQSDTA